MQTGPGLGARRLNYDMSPPASLPIIISLFSPACCRGTHARNLPPAQSSLVCVCVCVRVQSSPCTRHLPTVQYMCTLVNLPSRATVSSMSTSMPVRPAARLRSMSCLSPCREVRSRSVVVSAPASAASASPSSQSRCCQYAPAARRLAQCQCHHTRCCTSTHTHIVDSHPAAATATEHPVRGRVKARRPRGEAV